LLIHFEFFHATIRGYENNFSPRRSCGMRGSDRKRFLNYCLYAFGVPSLITLFVFISDQTTFIPEDYRIRMGQERCFIHSSKEVSAIYLFVPISLVLLLNIIFYSITAFKIFQVQKEISVVHNGDSGRHSKVDLDKARSESQ
jgi:G protein-coupled receptor Mth (Methuselah protein)